MFKPGDKLKLSTAGLAYFNYMPHMLDKLKKYPPVFERYECGQYYIIFQAEGPWTARGVWTAFYFERTEPDEGPW